jgi:hypothetical protein
MRSVLNVIVAVAAAMASPAEAQREPAVRAQAIGPNSISLGWDAAGSSVQEYRIFRDENGIGRLKDVSKLSFVDRGLSPSTSHRYEILAFTADGQSSSLGVATVSTLSADKLLNETTFEEAAPDSLAEIGGWVKASTNPRAISVTRERARAGRQSVKFDFQFEDWRGDTSFHNRTQLSQFTSQNITASELGKDYWVGISTYLDRTWEPDYDYNGELVWQFHGQRDGPAENGPPPVALYIFGNAVRVVVNADPATCYPAKGRSGPISQTLATFPLDQLKSRWVDWVVRVNFLVKGGGLDVWKDGVHVVNYEGPTLYNWCSATKAIGPFFALGTYKWDWGKIPTRVQSRIMFVDEIRIGGPNATCNDVKPSGAPNCM